MPRTTSLNPEHLFDQAEFLLAREPRIARQTDLRRAMSDAYYGIFHFISAVMADEMVGRSQRTTNRYALVYRRLDHRVLREVCEEARRRTATKRYAPFVPQTGWTTAVADFADLAIELQYRRHDAEYNPVDRFTRNEVALAIRSARTAVDRFAATDRGQKQHFVTLLLCPPR